MYLKQALHGSIMFTVDVSMGDILDDLTCDEFKDDLVDIPSFDKVDFQIEALTSILNLALILKIKLGPNL